MDANHRIKYQILRNALKWTGDPSPSGMTEDEINHMWEVTEEGQESDALQEGYYEFRSSGEPSDIPSKNYSRHYGSYDVAKMLDDGTWVGWTYWHGGGKHGDPESINWLDDAYLVNHSAEEKVMTVHSYARVLSAN